MTQAMLELAERCEKATGPDRELDWAIVKALHPNAHIGLYVVGDNDPTVWHAEPLVRNKSLLPAYTASLDAAMTLVPEGGEIDLFINRCQNGKAIAEVQYQTAVAASPALALVAAALRARAASSGEG